MVSASGRNCKMKRKDPDDGQPVGLIIYDLAPDKATGTQGRGHLPDNTVVKQPQGASKIASLSQASLLSFSCRRRIC